MQLLLRRLAPRNLLLRPLLRPSTRSLPSLHLAKPYLASSSLQTHPAFARGAATQFPPKFGLGFSRRAFASKSLAQQPASLESAQVAREIGGGVGEDGVEGEAAALVDRQAFFAECVSEPVILSTLVETQRQLVYHEGGTVLVTAGPGTGKSHVIAARIVNLIHKQACRPSEVLALTYTDKTAQTIQARVDLNTPIGLNDCTIKTFHAFCSDILQEFGMEVGLSPDVRVLSRPQQSVFVRQNIGNLGLERYKPVGTQPDSVVRALIEYFARLQDGNVLADEYLEFLTTKEGDREGLTAAAQDRVEQQRELARAYANYTRLKREENVVDFHDLVSLTSRLLATRPDTAKRIAERFQHVLVDEFQDVNPAILSLVKQLMAASSHSNLMVVGDDDQAIFAFRGAGSDNFRHFAEMYPEAEVVPLIRSFRSSDKLLECAHRLVSHNSNRLETMLGISKRLQGVPHPSDSPDPVQHLRFRSSHDETTGIAAKLSDLAGPSPNWARFAVLVRQNADIPRVVQALSHMGIPSSHTGGGKLFAQREVQLLLDLMSALTEPDNDTALYHLASSPVYQMPATVLTSATRLARQRGASLRSVLFEDLAKQDPTAVQGAAQARELKRDIETYETDIVETGARAVLARFLIDRELLDKFTAPDASLTVEERGRNVARFLRYLEDIERVLGTDRAAFVLPHIRALQSFGEDPEVDLEPQQQLQRHYDVLAPPPASLQQEEPYENAVQVMTIHKAKGLEFDVVFLMGASELKIPGFNRKPKLPLPAELLHVPPEMTREMHIEEERRLAYVALTRAREAFYFTSAADYGGRRAHAPSRYIAEALGIDTEQAPPKKVQKKKPAPLQPVAYPPPAEGKPLRLSYSKIDTYQRCPLQYQYQYVQELPQQRTAPLVLGSALHAGVAEFSSHIQKEPGTVPPFESLKAVFDAEWDASVFATRELAQERYEDGMTVLRATYDRLKAESEKFGDRQKPLLVEKRFSLPIEEANAEIVGYFDRVDELVDEDGVILREFKTNLSPFLKRNLKRNLQLKLYAKALQHVLGKLPLKSRIEGLRDGGSVELVPTAQDAADATRTVVEVANKIRNREFRPMPSYINCKLCAFSPVCDHRATNESF